MLECPGRQELDMVPRDCGAFVWSSDSSGSVGWGLLCGVRPTGLVLPSRLNWWELNLGMGVSEHLSDLVLVILKVSGGKLRH